MAPASFAERFRWLWKRSVWRSVPQDPEFQKGLTDGRRDREAEIVDPYFVHIQAVERKSRYEQGYTEAFEEVQSIERLRLVCKIES